MTISTSGFYQKNIDLFSRLNNDVGDIQVQVSTGKKSLSLKHDVQGISLLNASEEHKVEITQFNSNAERIVSDLERIDISFEQLQNASVRLKELHIESSNGFLTAEERKLFQIEIEGIKREILSIANGRDALGNGYFSGTSTDIEPFKINNSGQVNYHGSAVEKTLKISRDHDLRQNFSGTEVFLSAGTANDKFSIFEAIDEFSQSLDHEIASGISSNLFSKGASVDIVFPNSGQVNSYKFDLLADGIVYNIDAKVYGNDFNGLVTAINSQIPSSKVSASLSSDSKITLSGTVSDLEIRNFSTDLPRSMDQSVGIQKVVGSNINDEILLPSSLSNQAIQNRLHNVFEHFISMRTELGVASSTAQKFVDSTQNTLVDLNEDISKIEDADMAELLTRLQELLTNKEAAQATFSRLSSKNLFDFLG